MQLRVVVIEPLHVPGESHLLSASAVNLNFVVPHGDAVGELFLQVLLDGLHPVCLRHARKDVLFHLHERLVVRGLSDGVAIPTVSKYRVLAAIVRRCLPALLRRQLPSLRSVPRLDLSRRVAVQVGRHPASVPRVAVDAVPQAVPVPYAVAVLFLQLVSALVVAYPLRRVWLDLLPCVQVNLPARHLRCHGIQLFHSRNELRVALPHLLILFLQSCALAPFLRRPTVKSVFHSPVPVGGVCPAGKSFPVLDGVLRLMDEGVQQRLRSVLQVAAQLDAVKLPAVSAVLSVLQRVECHAQIRHIRIGFKQLRRIHQLSQRGVVGNIRRVGAQLHPAVVDLEAPLAVHAFVPARRLADALHVGSGLLHLLRFPQAFKVRAVGVRPGIAVLQSAQPLLHVDLRVIHVVERRFCILFRDFPVCHLPLQRVHVLRLRSGSLLHVCGEAALRLLQGALVIILCLRQERPLLRVAVAQLCQQLVDKLQDAPSQRPVLLHHGADTLLVGQQILFHILRHDLRINGRVVRQVLAVPRIQFRLLLPHGLQVYAGLPDAVQYQLLQIAVASACLDAVRQFVADDLRHRVLATCVDIDFPVRWVVVAVVHSSGAIRAFVEEHHLAPHDVGDALYLGDGVLVHACKNARAFRFRLGSRSSLPRFRLFHRRQNTRLLRLHGLSQRRSLAFLLCCTLLRLRFRLLSCRQYRSAGLFRHRQHHAFRLFLSGSGLSCSRFRPFQHSGGLRKQSADLRIRQLLALVQLVLQLLSQLVCLAVFIKGLRRLDDAVHHLVAHLAQRAAGLLVSGVSLHRSDAHTRRGHGAAG